ncbi:MAG: hypothetical protein JW807_09470 [Spirochaetes bacterium]|nr:hypothetical protein [Spirochaetota bacterium]
MKKLLIKSALLVLLVVSTLIGVIYFMPADDNLYLAATLDKHRLLDEVPQPRIIFTGDSNLAFGLDSAMVQRATGYNIINMGLHGGLGLNYYLDELKPHLKKGDIVIIILDYQNFFFDGGGANTLVEISIFNPKILLYYSPKGYYNYLISLPLAFQRRLRGVVSSAGGDMAFLRSNFNKYGDNVGHLNMPQPKLLVFKRPMPKKVNDNMVKIYNDFYDTWTPRGVRVYVSFSPLLIQDRKEQTEALAELYGDMKKRLKPAVIGEPTAFMYPEKYFYDNLFHLNAGGRRVRTADLVRAIKKIPELASVPSR